MQKGFKIEKGSEFLKLTFKRLSLIQKIKN